MLSIFTQYKWIALGILIVALVGFAGIQTYRVAGLKAEITLLNEQIQILKDNEAKYLAAIEEQQQKIADIQNLVNKNEKAFQDYVEAQQQKNAILSTAKVVTITKGQENTIGVIDSATSDSIKEFYNARYRAWNAKASTKDQVKL